MNILVSAVATGKVYGASDPALTYTVTAGSPMSGDAITGALARVAGEDAGAYEIQQGSLGINSNYVISFTPGVFTIDQLPVAAGGMREYDGTTAAQFSILDVTNKVGSDDVGFASGVGTLASSNVGLRAITSFGTLALGGAQAANYTLTGATGAVEIIRAQATVNLSNLAQVYNGAARVVGVTTAPAGLSYSLTYAGNPWAPTNAGNYQVVAQITDANYTGGATGTLVVSPLPVQVGGTRVYDGTANADWLILDVTNKIGSDFVDVAGGSGTLASSNVGLHEFASFGTLVLGGLDVNNYTMTGATGAVEITQAQASVNLSNLAQVYNGAARVVDVTTVPPGLSYSLTYAGNAWAPTNAGNYQVIALITDANYTGGTTGTLAVSPLPVQVGGTRVYDGTANAEYAILNVTNRIGSDDVDFASGIGTLASSNVGFRAITGFGTLALGGAQALNYTLTGATGAVEITRAQASVNLSNLAQVYNGAARVAGVTTVPEKLSCSLTYAGNAWAPTNAGNYQVIALITDGNYSGGTTGTLVVSRLPVKAGGTRAYNGTATALYTILDVTNRVGSDAVDFVSGSGTLASPDVGLRAITSFGTLALGGAKALNYTLAGASGAVRITAPPGTPPVITVHPQSVTVYVGSAVGFIVRATGTAPLSYQWQKNGVNIAGATSSNYNIGAVALSHAGQYRCRVANAYGAATSHVAVLTVGMKPARRVINDFDGDGKSDGVIIHTSAVWKAVFSSMSYAPEYTIWSSGLQGWLPVPGDYDGDFRTDGGMYNPSSGMWYVYMNTTPPQLRTAQYGAPGDLPVQADYDGDMKTDPWLYNPQTRIWKGLKSSQNYAIYTMPFTLGGPGFRPVPEDYDADGKADPAVYSEATGEWIVAMSGSGYQRINMFFGGPNQSPVPMDYDGDGLADPGVYERYTGLWQVAMSGQGYAIVSAVLGTSRSIPIMADYDGDGKADPALYQLSTGFWRVYLSSQNYAMISGYFGNWQYTPVTESVACRP